MTDTDDDTWLHSDEDDEDVTASEVAAYTYCAKAWHLEHVGQKPVDPVAMSRRSAGVDRHLVHGARLAHLSRFGRRSVWASVALLVVAGVLVVAAMLL